jgi:hypothetical protein
MACETSKSFQKEVNEITWKEYKGEDFNYQYPSSLVSIRNPRAYESQRDIQYFLLNKQIASDYMDCLQTAKKQWEAYRLDGVEPDWVDWEGACDINRVILQISVGKKSLEDITDNSNQSNENSQPYSIKSNQGNLWIVNPSGGMGDTIAIEAHTQHNGHIQSIVISSHLRGMSKFIDPNDNYAASEYDFDNKHLEAFKSIAHHILSTFEFNDQTQATTDDDASELPSEIIKYAPKSDWQTYTDDLANFEIQFESSSKVSDNPGATVKGESLSITSCQFNDPQGKEVCLTDYSIRVFNNYTGGSRRTWFQANINSYKPYYVNWIIDGKKALVAIDGNPGGSSSLNILIPYDNQIIVFWVSGVAWDPDTGELPDLSYFKSILSTFKTLK